MKRWTEYRRALRRTGGSLRWLAVDSSAASAIEYALVLGILIGGALLGAQFLASATNGAFSKLAAAGNGTSNAGGSHSSRTGGQASATESQPTRWAPVAVTAVTAVLVGFAIWGLLRRRDRTSQAAAAETAHVAELSSDLPEKLFGKRQNLLRLFNTHLSAVLHEQLEVRHLMSERLAVVAPEASVQDVRTRMEQDKIRHLLVCDRHGSLVGILSDRDIKSRTGKLARDIMTANPISVQPKTAVSPAITLMMNRAISCLPVTNEGKLVGILTTTDLMLALQCNLQLMQRVADALRTEPAAVAPPEPAEECVAV